MATTDVSNSVNTFDEIVRPKNIFPPNPWGERFLNFTFDHELAGKYANEIETLKDEVRISLTAPGSEMMNTMDLIEKLERLGISYHFEDEIEEKLQRFFNQSTNYTDAKYDLYTISTHFRIFRQHGYHMVSDVFSKFKEGEGKFKESVKSDVMGLLGLYEASHVRIRGEDILEYGLVYAKENLKFVAPNLNSSPLKKLVEHALFQPLHSGHQRAETHHYISIYEEDESRNEMLLKFAKLDYNIVQMLHKQELHEMSMWWKELNLASKLPYMRDRIVECHFWSIGAFPIPQYSRGRFMVTKVNQILTLIDDTFDAYGTIEELDKFNDAVQRWDMREMDGLPEYMKPIYTALLDMCEQFKQTMVGEGRSHEVDYFINAFKEQVRNYNVEAKWFIEGHLPPFSDYLSNALITFGALLIYNVSLLGICRPMKEEFEWLTKKPRLVVASQEYCRFIADVGTHEVEKGRGQKSSGIESYMMEYGVTKEEAMEKFLEMGGNAWKDVNENMLMPYPCCKDLLLIILNCIRLVDVLYNKNGEDGFTNSAKLIKPQIFAVYVHPFNI